MTLEIVRCLLAESSKPTDQPLRRLGIGRVVLGGDPAPPTTKNKRHTPNFRPITVVAKRRGGSKYNVFVVAQYLFGTGIAVVKVFQY